MKGGVRPVPEFQCQKVSLETHDSHERWFRFVQKKRKKKSKNLLLWLLTAADTELKEEPFLLKRKCLPSDWLILIADSSFSRYYHFVNLFCGWFICWNVFEAAHLLAWAAADISLWVFEPTNCRRRLFVCSVHSVRLNRPTARERTLWTVPAWTWSRPAAMLSSSLCKVVGGAGGRLEETWSNRG